MLKKLFRHSVPVEPSVRFGRYTDAYKAEAKYDAWDRALEKFDNNEYAGSFSDFFEYLQDPSEDNVHCTPTDDGMVFELYQGSKKITGSITSSMIRAQAQVAHAGRLDIGFLRRMLEQNYALRYSRYALDDNDNLTLLFDSFLLDGSPYKLYYGLKEIALHADKQDDLLLAEFTALQPINVPPIRTIDTEEKQVKSDFLRSRITGALDIIDSGRLSAEQYPGAIGYLLMDLVYAIDYLVRPEGQTMEGLERIHREYFAEDGKSPFEKNIAARKALEEILNLPDDTLHAELYVVSCTFGLTSPADQDQFNNFIDGELGRMDWYTDHRYADFAMAIAGYIVGYSLFNHAYPPPLHDALRLYYRIVEPEFYAALGFAPALYDRQAQVFERKAIIDALITISDRHKAKYPCCVPQVRTLQYDSPAAFAKSYLLMLRNMDLARKV